MKPKNTLWLVVLTVFLAAGLWAKDVHFYFAQVTDTHLGAPAEFRINERLDYIVRSLNYSSLEPKFAVFTGDIVHEAIHDENNAEVSKGLGIIKQLSMPAYFAAGNHDIEYRDDDKAMKAFKKKLGPVPHRAEYEGIVLLFPYMDTEKGKTAVSVSDYDLIQWLEKELKAAGGKPVIIFQHNPFVEDFYNNRLHENGSAELREKYTELINKYNVKAVIAGHFHRDEHHWFGNVPLYVSAPVINYWGRQTTYRIYEYDNGRISYSTQYLELK